MERKLLLLSEFLEGICRFCEKHMWQRGLWALLAHGLGGPTAEEAACVLPVTHLPFECVVLD